MLIPKKYSTKKVLFLPLVFLFASLIACTFEMGILDPTAVPTGQSEDRVQDYNLAAGASPEAKETTQPIPTKTTPDCQESPLAGLVFSNRNPSEQIIQVGTCGRHIKLSPQADMKISPSGEQALYTQDDDIWVVDLLSGDRRNLTSTPDRVEVNPQWWPGNLDQVIFGSWETGADIGPTAGYLSMVSIDRGDYRILADQTSNTDPAPKPDEPVIAYDLGSTAWLYHLEMDESELFDIGSYGLNIDKGMKIGSPSWSPDGKKLTWWVGGVFSPPVDGSIALAVFDLERGNVELLHPHTPAGTGGWIPTPIWSLDGKWIAVVTLAESHKVDLWVINTDSGEEHMLGFASNPIWHPESRALVYRSWPVDEIMLVEIDGWKMQRLDLLPGSMLVDWLGIRYDNLAENQPTPSSTDPLFGPEVLFASEPDPAKNLVVFPYGTSEIFAIWPYRNMREGLTIRREWYLDGRIWIVREEPWDYAKYGRDGVVTDISVYDYDLGLEPGRYQLRLFIDGQEQRLGSSEAFSSAYFTISTPIDISPLASPDFSQLAIVDPPGTLIIQDVETQAQRSLFTMEEISSLAWYPDGKYILFSVRNRLSKAGMANPSGYIEKLWVVNLTTGEPYPFQDQFGQETGNGLHHPYISPDGLYVAAIAGTGWGDACHVDSNLWVKEIGFSRDLLHEVFSYYQIGFTIDPAPQKGEMYVERIIGWDSPTQLKVELGWTCTTENLDGIYLLDMSTLTAEKIGEAQ